MSGRSRPGGPAGWFVRRAGLARFTTVALAFGLCLAAFAGPQVLVAVAGLSGVLLVLIGYVGLRRHSAGEVRVSLTAVVSIILIGLFSGYLLGTLRVAALDQSELARHIDTRLTGQITVTGPVRSSAFWQSAAAVVENARPVQASGGDPQAGRALAAAAGEPVYLEVVGGGEDGFVLEQGHQLLVRATVREPEGESASGFDQRAYLRNRGIQVVLEASASGVEVVGRRGGVSGWFDGVRAAARAHLSRGPDDRLHGVLQGIVMGDTAGISEEWMEAFRRSGTAHMFSVSGLHVAALAAIMMGLSRLLRAPRWLGFLLAAGASALMIPFVGESPPVVRAVVMISIVLFGRWLGRGRDRWQILALAAAVVLGMNPYAIYDVGFQLSFAAFAGMFSLIEPVQKALHFLPPSVSGNVAVSAAASVGTAPVALATFGRASAVSVFANMVVVPVLPVITGLGLASVVAGFVWPGISTALDTALTPVLAWTVQSSRLFAVAPVFESSQLWRGMAATAVGVLAVPAAFAVAGRVIALPRGLSPPFYRRTMRWLYVRRSRKRHLAVALAAGLIVCCLVSGWTAYPWVQRGVARAMAAVWGDWPEAFEIRVLDIGQGNAVLARTPDGHAVLFDAGPAESGLEGQLCSAGVTTLDLAVISHPHADHFAGLLECLDTVSVEALLDRTELVPESAAAQPAAAAAGETGGWEARSYLDLRHRLEESGTEHVMAQDSMVLQLGGLSLRIYAPERPLQMVDGENPWALRGAPPGGDELNAGSIVVVATWEGSSFLLPGDAEADTLQRYDLPQVKMALAPHHGSRDGLTAGLLQRTTPQVAVISSGEGNTYGHPAPETLTLLQEHVPTIFRTDLQGWVCFEVDEDTIRITTERKARARAPPKTSVSR